LVQALPEFKKLANYGGNTLEDNLRIVGERAALLRRGLEEARMRVAQRYNSSLGSGFRVDPVYSDVSALAVYGDGSLTASDMDKLIQYSLILGQPTSRNPETNALDAKLRKAVYNRATQEDLAFLMSMLRFDDPNLTVDQMVKKQLETHGISYVPRYSKQGVISKVKVPFTVNPDDGSVAPSVDLRQYADGLDKLYAFKTNNLQPAGIINSINVQIAKDGQQFLDMYSAIKDDTGSATVNTLGAYLNKGNVLLNHEAMVNTEPTLGGASTISETLLHEVGHGYHATLGETWGLDSSEASKAYIDGVGKNFVSNYGKNDPREHFAESFAKYISTGEATPEFTEYLKDKLGVSPIDLSSIPDVLQGTNLVDNYVKWMNEVANLSGYTFVLESSSSPLAQATPEELQTAARDLADTGGFARNRYTFSLDGHFKDPQGNTVKLDNRNQATVQRTFNWEPGNFVVDHAFFKLPDQFQGNGLGTAFVDASFDYYRTIGVNRVTVHAALKNGPYIWALRGFDFDGEYERSQVMEIAKNHYAALKAYQANLGEYGKLSVTEAVLKMRISNVNLPSQSTLDRIIFKARENGWNIDNNLINELEFIVNNGGTVTAEMFANIGRGNKNSKKSSTVGRSIMMEKVDWHGHKDL
jgi:GNAT superfamily N-acetyltransferase